MLFCKFTSLVSFKFIGFALLFFCSSSKFWLILGLILLLDLTFLLVVVVFFLCLLKHLLHLSYPQEYNVRASANTDKAFSIGRFVTGLPPFSKKKNAENKWSLYKEGLQGRQLTDSLRVCTNHSHPTCN